ncbi:19285_t:CDS:1, partial [Gigaspora margarita]
DNIEVTVLQEETSLTSEAMSLKSNTDIFDSKIVVRSHIFPSQNSALLFVYDSEKHKEQINMSEKTEPLLRCLKSFIW